MGSIASRFDLRNNAEWADERRNQFRIGDNYFYRVVKTGGTTFAAVPASLLLHIPEEIFWLCPSGSRLLNGTTTWQASPLASVTARISAKLLAAKRTSVTIGASSEGR